MSVTQYSKLLTFIRYQTFCQMHTDIAASDWPLTFLYPKSFCLAYHFLTIIFALNTLVWMCDWIWENPSVMHKDKYCAIRGEAIMFINLSIILFEQFIKFCLLWSQILPIILKIMPNLIQDHKNK